jgi:parallel beta-helix repeat protein
VSPLDRSTGSRRRWAAGLALVVVVWLSPGSLLAADPSAFPSASGSPRPPVSSAEHPPGTLQALIDATPPGGSLVVPPGLYRESVEISAPIRIDGSAAEIRGSDPWSDWDAAGSRWRSGDTVPELDTGGECREPRCAWPEQVFVDGRALLQVAEDPGAGEFAVDEERHVVLADDPTDRLVEVTTRPRWVTVEGADVEIAGFTMRHAASPAQQGGVQALGGGDRLVVRDVELEDAHGALLSFQDVRDASLLDSVLRRGGQLAVHIGGGGTQGVVVARNHLLDSNTEGFDFGWEAGGLKAAVSSDLTFEDNVVENNDGAGLWCDIDCTNVRYLNNRVSHNAGAGIFFEISDGATIEGNVVWENNWADPAWGWGAGILISSSTDVVVRNNVVAWNGDGISVISQRRDREDGDAVEGIDVSANTVAIGPGGGFLLAWLQDWDGPMFEPGADNVGSANGFFLGADAPDTCHWEWAGCQGSVEDFAATPGGGGSRMLDEAEFAAILQGAELDPLPEPHVVVADPPRPRDLLRLSFVVPVLAGVLAVGVVAIAVIVVVRSRRRRADPS